MFYKRLKLNTSPAVGFCTFALFLILLVPGVSDIQAFLQERAGITYLVGARLHLTATDKPDVHDTSTPPTLYEGTDQATALDLPRHNSIAVGSQVSSLSLLTGDFLIAGNVSGNSELVIPFELDRAYEVGLLLRDDVRTSAVGESSLRITQGAAVVLARTGLGESRASLEPGTYRLELRGGASSRKLRYSFELISNSSCSNCGHWNGSCGPLDSPHAYPAGELKDTTGLAGETICTSIMLRAPTPPDGCPGPFTTSIFWSVAQVDGDASVSVTPSSGVVDVRTGDEIEVPVCLAILPGSPLDSVGVLEVRAQSDTSLCALPEAPEQIVAQSVVLVNRSNLAGGELACGDLCFRNECDPLTGSAQDCLIPAFIPDACEESVRSDLSHASGSSITEAPGSSGKPGSALPGSGGLVGDLDAGCHVCCGGSCEQAIIEMRINATSDLSDDQVCAGGAGIVELELLNPGDCELTVHLEPRYKTGGTGRINLFPNTVTFSPGQIVQAVTAFGSIHSSEVNDVWINVNGGSAVCTLCARRSLTVSGAPVITGQPQEQAQCEGGITTFTVQADPGQQPPLSGPLSYQWKKNGNDLSDGGNVSGANTDTLTLSPTTSGDVGAYTVAVSNDCSTVVSNSASLSILSVEMTAYRPTTEGPAYGNLFLRRTVPDVEEEDPGAGIRVNGDTESAGSENDLIEVQINVTPFPPAGGTTFHLVRSNSNIKVWDSQTMGTALFDTGTEAPITITGSSFSVWVENPAGGSADLELVARSGGNDLCFDRIHFYPFTSIVIALGGEDQVPSDPADSNHGAFQLAIELYRQGYDVHMYDEDNVSSNGSGIVYDEVVSAIQNRGVSQVAIFGYSHGGGSTYDLSERLDSNRGSIGTFTIPFTAFVDGVENDSDIDLDQEHKRPPASAYMVNYYQEGTIADFWLDGGPIDPPGAEIEDNVDDPVVTHTHYTVDDASNILDDFEARLIPRVTK